MTDSLRYTPLDTTVDQVVMMVKSDPRINQRLAFFLAEVVEDVLAIFEPDPGRWFWPDLKNPSAVRSERVFALVYDLLDAIRSYGEGRISPMVLKIRHGAAWNAASHTGSQIGYVMTTLACRAASCLLSSLDDWREAEIGAFLEKCQGLITRCTVFAQIENVDPGEFRTAKALEAQRQDERLRFWAGIGEED